jgi:site-specific recombinase XerC
VAVSGFFEWAASNGHAVRNPTTDVRGIALPARRPKALDARQLRRLMRRVERAGSERDLAWVELLVGTGLRVSEALALQMSDVRMSERNGEVVVDMGKKGNFRRVPLTASVRSALRAYLATLDSPPGDDEPLWRGQRGPVQTTIPQSLTERSGLGSFVLIAARTPAPAATRVTGSTRACTPAMVARYQKRISGPLLKPIGTRD